MSIQRWRPVREGFYPDDAGEYVKVGDVAAAIYEQGVVDELVGKITASATDHGRKDQPAPWKRALSTRESMVRDLLDRIVQRAGLR